MNDIPRKVICDTNTLLDGLNVEDFEHVVVSIVVVEELDHLKKSENGDLAQRARKANKMLESADNVEVVFVSDFALPKYLDGNINDNKIIAFAKDIVTSRDGYVFLSNDLNVRLKAKNLGIACQGYGSKGGLEGYNGWKEFIGNTEQINEYRQQIEDRKIKFLINEYLIQYNSDTKEWTEERFDGEKFVRLSLPPSKVIKGRNAQQRCALDLLNNKDIPVKIINGTFGSGKTKLTVSVGLQMIEKGIYNSMTLWRTPIPADGVDIGYLPGDKEQKTHDYMRPMLQYIEKEGNPFYLENLIREEKIKMDVCSFLKGVNVPDSFIIYDECEDLNVKLIKLVGTRMSEGSCICLLGDYNQAENRFKSDNGLLKAVRDLKGDPLVGIVNLPEDLRSKASKLFADL
jgi:PhoH-like ATPase